VLRNAAAGFSLVELMIALGAMGIIVMFALGSFTAQHQTYVVVDQVSETQQNTRAIAALLERDIRNAGFMVPPAAASCGVDNDDGSDVLFVSDAGAIRTVDQLPQELAALELGATTSVEPSTGSTVVTVDDVVIDQQASYDEDGDGTDDTDFQEQGGAIVVDVANPGRGVACGIVSSIDSATQLSVVFENELAAGTAFPPQLRVVPAHVYRVVDPGGGAPPELRRNGVALARDVEDLQVAWFYDDDRDGQIDGGEYRGDSSLDYDNEAVDGNDLREIRINLVLRTRSDDPRNPDSAGTGQARENRDTSVPGDDGRRRRVHTATVRLRNVAL
jgi:prepilin-type N-terminal cleavage/methylation domain-containing protein